MRYDMQETIIYLEDAVKSGASDLFVVAGAPITKKVSGRLVTFDTQKLSPENTESFITAVYAIAGRDMEKYQRSGDDDFSFSVSGLARFRVNAYRQRGSYAAVIRIVAFTIPSYTELGIPEEVMKLSQLTCGLVLFTGTAGSGKSTTQACIIDRINRTRSCHIVTLEDPIEYLHRNDKSIVSQREIAIDTESYLSALRACLRQSPDVILLGEMRDAETIQTAMTAAETGHTVFATLHTGGTANSIDRIIDAFPSNQQAQVRVQLSLVLNSVVSQKLLPGVSENLVSAFEIMHTNSAIRSLIRDGKTHQLLSTISGAASEGMISMDQYIFELYKNGKISSQTALEFSENPEQIGRRIDHH